MAAVLLIRKTFLLSYGAGTLGFRKIEATTQNVKPSVYCKVLAGITKIGLGIQQLFGLKPHPIWINFGRVSLTKLDQALALTTSDAFNPFCAGLNCNDEGVYVTISRDNKSELFMWDFKISNPAALTIR